MNRKMMWMVLSVLVMASLVLSACAPAAAPAPTQAPQVQPTAPAQPAEPTKAPEVKPTEAPAAGPVALRWRTRPDNKEEIAVYGNVSDELAKKLGYELKYEPGGSETSSYQDVLKTEIAAGTAPDVFWIPGTDVADFATRGLIRNNADLAKGFDVNAFYPGPMYHLTYNPETDKTGADSGALWGLPRDVSTFALYLKPRFAQGSRRTRSARAGQGRQVGLGCVHGRSQEGTRAGQRHLRLRRECVVGSLRHVAECGRWRLLQRSPRCLRVEHA